MNDSFVRTWKRTSLVVAAVLLGLTACHGNADRSATTDSSGQVLHTQSTSATPISDAIVFMQTTSRGLAEAVQPGGDWVEHLPDGADDRGGATDTCVDDAGRDTSYRTVPFKMTADFDVDNGALSDAALSKAETYLAGEGFDTSRGSESLTAGRVAGFRDGFLVSLDLRTDWRQLVIEGVTPCVR